MANTAILYCWIALGSAIGGAARYWCTGFAARILGETFPWGTLCVNVAGSFIIGFFATLTGPDGRVFASTTTSHFVMVTGFHSSFGAPSTQRTSVWRM